MNLRAVEDESCLANSSTIASAANMPLFIALWVPFILATFINPGLQPTRQPPGNVNFGKH